MKTKNILVLAFLALALLALAAPTAAGPPVQVAGACCLPDGSCEYLPYDSCVGAGGVFQGPGVQCFEVTCPGPVGGVTEPLGTLGVVVPVIALAAVVAAGAAATVLVKRRAA